MNPFYFLFLIRSQVSCQHTERPTDQHPKTRVYALTMKQAEKREDFQCTTKPLLYKPGLIIFNESDLQMTVVPHPAFYGCFDCHSLAPYAMKILREYVYQ